MKIIRKPQDFPKHNYMVVVPVSQVRVIRILVSTGTITGTYAQVTIIDEDVPMSPSVLGKMIEALDMAQKLMDGKLSVGDSDWTFLPRHI